MGQPHAALILRHQDRPQRAELVTLRFWPGNLASVPDQADAGTGAHLQATHRPQGYWDFIRCPADIILFGGARGGAKTIGSLLDFWYHAIEHGEDARGLMVRKQRTDLRIRS